MKRIDINMPPEDKTRYKLVRSDSLTYIEHSAEAVSADAVAGKFCLLVQKCDAKGWPVVSENGKPVREAALEQGFRGLLTRRRRVRRARRYRMIHRLPC